MLFAIALIVEAGVDLVLESPGAREAQADWLHRISARALRKMGITWTVHGDFPAKGAVITNHQSYVDILLLAALHPCVFVSKAEVKTLPILGWIATMIGTVFVERGSGGSALRASEGLKAAYDAGVPIVFFPEGTTNTGQELLPFHSGLLAQVLMIGEPIYAGHIRYSIGPDNPPGASVEENIAWGDLPMWTHIFRFLGLRGVHADVRFASDPIAFRYGPSQRKLAANEARTAVASLAAPEMVSL